jgi:hypothetical protein
MEPKDRVTTAESHRYTLLNTHFTILSTNFGNLTRLGAMVSIKRKFNEIFIPFPEQRNIFSKGHRSILTAIHSTFKRLILVMTYDCFVTPTDEKNLS